MNIFLKSINLHFHEKKVMIKDSGRTSEYLVFISVFQHEPPYCIRMYMIPSAICVPATLYFFLFRIEMMQQSGLLKRYEEMYWPPDECQQRRIEESKTRALTLNDILIVFIILISGVSAACMVLIIELNIQKVPAELKKYRIIINNAIKKTRHLALLLLKPSKTLWKKT